MSGHRWHRGVVLGIAVGGVLAGHWITYRLVSPHPDVRQALLAGSGHGYLSLANDIGLALAMVGLASVVLGRMIDRDSPRRGRWFRQLAGFGVVAFVAMEVLERITSGAPLVELLHHGLLPAGVAVQVLVAAMAAVAIRWLLRAVDRSRGTLAASTPPLRRLLIGHVAVGWHPPLRLLPSADGIRGPPSVR